jgi:hypothetical protein
LKIQVKKGTEELLAPRSARRRRHDKLSVRDRSEEILRARAAWTAGISALGSRLQKEPGDRGVKREQD